MTDDELRAMIEAATPGPWRWEISLVSKRVELSGDGGDLTVMDFVRWGMSGAAARFWHWSGKPRIGNPKRADELAVPEPGREHHASWYRVIDDPNARLIAAAPDLAAEVLRLRAQATRLTESAAESEANTGHALHQLAAVRAAAKAFSHDHWGWGSGERQGRKTCDFCHGVGAYDDWTGPIQHDAGCKTAILRAALTTGDTDDRA